MSGGKRFHFLVAVHAFFFKEGQVLLSQRKNTGYMDGHWSVPAGHVDSGESIVGAMQREISEEVGLNLFLGDPVHVMHRLCSPTEERIDFFFRLDDWLGDPDNTEAEKCEKLRFFSLTTLPKEMVPYIRFALKQVVLGNIFSEYRESSYSEGKS